MSSLVMRQEASATGWLDGRSRTGAMRAAWPNQHKMTARYPVPPHAVAVFRINRGAAL